MLNEMRSEDTVKAMWVCRQENEGVGIMDFEAFLLAGEKSFFRYIDSYGVDASITQKLKKFSLTTSNIEYSLAGVEQSRILGLK